MALKRRPQQQDSPQDQRRKHPAEGDMPGQPFYFFCYLLRAPMLSKIVA